MYFYRLFRLSVFTLCTLLFYSTAYGSGLLPVNVNNDIEIALGKSKVVFRADDIIKIKLCDKYYKSEFFVQTGRKSDIRSSSGQIVYKQEIKDETRNISVSFAVTFEIQEREIKAATQVSVDSEDYIIKEVSMPVPEFYYPDDALYSCYYPSGMGKRVDNLENLGKVSFNYPGDHGTMQWCTMNNAENGVYIGTHDELQQPKAFEIYRKKKGVIATELKMPVHSDRFQSPAMIVRFYEGSWREAARFYRTWYDTGFRIVDSPAWLKESPGLMLNILKQQNGEVIYPFSEIDTIMHLGEKMGFNLLGLWGRGVGGHDRFYPNYMPDPLLGGAQAAREAIGRAKENDFKVVTYINGKIIDVSTDYYSYYGVEAVMLDQRGKPYIEVWKKYENISPVVFAACCPASGEWQRKILELAKDSYMLGADVLYVDQVSQVDPNVVQCYAKHHRHKRPCEAYSGGRVELMRNLRNYMTGLDEKYQVIITEGINDSMLPYVNMFQGVLYSVHEPTAFPELFKFTFPEVLGIVSNSNPVLDRYEANYNVVYGLKNEIMTRYRGDRKFLLGGAVTGQDYRNVTGPPDINKLMQIERDQAQREVKAIFEFVRKHTQYLNHGRFIDEEGIFVKRPDKNIVVKGYKHNTDNSVAVMVWNKGSERVKIPEIVINGYQLKTSYKPDGIPGVEEGYLSPNTIGMLVFDSN